ncbi:MULTISPECIES: Gp49 family protein [Bacillota]|jgi:hypothetical protein|uniref:Uncharacterized protein n=1 Tax=[Eubacterium] hominis TaxID=2764325 RepID=A0A7G9GPN5_9FIRM|nr:MULTISPECIES: Gp49 family protein [Bacillota]QNM12767.1 hypothetical protein H9Q80_02110 [[Eubacterium] hominis]DAY68626.1 MAG TPA: hypothetical protein [Caudoviricetes sp.]RGB58272.1 hypothetical protein DW271_00840 [Absiella sp. AM22-9]RGB60044.1 hypothetical protein DW120_10460 [Absiella sp. AM10-20]RGB63560.1 hypothetical protein DW113_17930 [Absiella sp. AM09-45]
MNSYIGTKLIKAEVMNLGDYNKYKGWQIPADEEPEKEGYLVQYSDDYCSWSPKDVFEKAYLKVDDNPVLPSGVSVGPDMVENFIKEKHVSTLGDRTTLVRCVLVNGFEIVESSACVDPLNYNERMGTEICMEKIKDKIWYLLGFLLQTAWKGIK